MCLKWALSLLAKIELPTILFGKRSVRAGCTSSQLFPVGECHQLVQNVLQPLKATGVIPRCVGFVLAPLQVLAIRFTNLGYFASQVFDAFFDGILHGDKATLVRENLKAA